MVVLSLFDGISSGQYSLQQAGIPVKLYMASEINPYAMKITRSNFPGTLFCGDVTKLDVSKLPLIPDLIIAGSPCQGFSFAGKQLNFDDPRSRLFFEFLRILKEVRKLNPDVLWLLENVPMKKKFEHAISMALMTKPVMIDAALVSAQSRKRLYWCNWHVPQPEDRGIVLKDVLQEWEYVKDYVHTAAAADYINRAEMNSRFVQNSEDTKGNCVTATWHKGAPYNVLQDARFGKNYVQWGNGTQQQNRAWYLDSKAPTVLSGGTSRSVKIITGCRQVGRKLNDRGVRDDYNPQLPTVQQCELREDGKANCVTTVSKDSMVCSVAINGRKQPDGTVVRKIEQRKDAKAYAVISVQEKSMVKAGYMLRRLTEIEVERLFGLPDQYTNHVSSTRRYEALGNGWQCDVIQHIFRHMPVPNT